MPTFFRPFPSLFLLLAITLAGGQNDESRGDVAPEFAGEGRPGDGPSASAGAAAAADTCSCKGSVAAGVILTCIVFLILGALWWCFQEHRRRRRGSKPDIEALGKAAYDNPQFEEDDLDKPQQDGQHRITIGPTGPPIQTTVLKDSTQTTTIATNTSGTLERKKSTLERVMAAVLRGSRPDSKRTKDDSCWESKDVIVPLQGHDFTGLGFTIAGNLKEGTFVKEVFARGPASQSGQVSPGDRIVALTVITDHMVFNDALTILSYASPYPVLLHLNKRQSLSGTFSAAGTSSSASLPPSRGKKTNRSSSSSLHLGHPAFRSQSSGDLAKIGDIDVMRLKMGDLIPPSKAKHTSGLALELSKAKINRSVHRQAESRHSERAIDVPGVEIRSKSVAVDIDRLNADKGELAHVQVHRPMSPIVGIDRLDTSIEVPKFCDSSLSGMTENVPHPKAKFGVKVFPDIGFKSVNKDVEIDLDGGKTKLIPKFSPESGIEVQHNKENSQIELNVDLSAQKFKDINLKTSNLKSGGYVDGKSDKKGFKFGMPDINFSSFNMCSEKTKSKDSEIGMTADLPEIKKKNEISAKIKLPSLNLKTENSEIQGKSASVDNPDINLPTPSLIVDSKNDKSYDDGIKIKESEGDFKIELPGFSTPSFGISGNAKDDDDRNRLKLKHDFELENPDMPYVNLQAGMNRDNADINESGIEIDKKKIKSKHGFKIGMPDIHMPSFNIKGSAKGDKNVGIDLDAENQLKLQEPNANIPLVSINAGIKDSDDHDNQSGDEKDKKKSKSKHGFKIGMPDINMPSFNSLKGSVKGDKDIEIKSSPEHDSHFEGPNVNVTLGNLSPAMKSDTNDHDDQKDKNFKSKYGFSTGMSGMYTPSFDLKESSKREKNIDIESKTEHDLELEKHDITLPSVQLAGGIKDDQTWDNDSDEDNEKNETKSKSGFKMGMPDSNLPSFNLTSSHKADKNLDFKSKTEYDLSLISPTANIPSVSRDARIKEDKQNESECESYKTKKSNHSFKIGMADFSMASLNFKGNVKNNRDIDIESKAKHDFRIEGPGLNVETGLKVTKADNVELENEKEKKSKHGFKIGMPDFNMLSFNLKGSVKGDNELDDEKSKQELKVECPDVNVPSINVRNTIKAADDYEIDSGNENDKNSKSKHGFNIGMPDSFNMPSFGQKGSSKDKDIDAENQHKVQGSNVNVPSISMDIGIKDGDGDEQYKKNNKSKHEFKIGLPDVSIPSFGINGGGKAENDFDVKSKSRNYPLDEPDINIPSLNVKAGVTTGDEHCNELYAEKDNNRSTTKRGFKIGVPDINIPSFSLKRSAKGDNAIDIDLCAENQLNLQGPPKIPSVSMEVREKDSDFPDNESGEEKKTKSKSKHSFGIGMPDINVPSFNIKGSSKTDGDFRIDSKSKHGMNLYEPHINIPSDRMESGVKYESDHDTKSGDEKEKKKSKSKQGFKIAMPDMNIPSFGLKGSSKSDKDRDVTSKTKHDLKVEVPAITIPSASLKARIKTDGDHDTESGDEKGKKKMKSKHSFKIGMPEINMPSFNLKGNTKIDKHLDISDKTKHGIGVAEVNIPSASIKAVVKTDNDNSNESVENEKKIKSKHGFKIGMPDINMPTFNLKGSAKGDKDVDIESHDFQLQGLKGDKDVAIESHDFQLQRHDITSVSMESGTTEDHGNESGDDKDKQKSKSKHRFKIGMPDINMPSFNIKGSASTDRFVEIEPKFKHEYKIDGSDINIPSIQMETEIKSSNNNLNDKDNKTKTKHGFKLGMPDINMPSFNLKGPAKADMDFDEDKFKLNHDFNLEEPNKNMPSINLETDKITDNYESQDEKDKKHKYGFKMEMPDISMPSFNLKGNRKEGKDSDNDYSDVKSKSEHKFSLDKPSLKISSLSVEAGVKPTQERKKESDTEKDVKSKSHRGFKVERPDINMPSFNLRGTGKMEKDVNTESENNKDEKSPSKEEFKIELHDINMPSLNLEGGRKSDNDFDIESKSKHYIKFQETDTNMPSANIESGVAVDIKHNKDFESEKDKEKSESNLSFKIGMPDFNMPYFDIKGSGKTEHDSNDENNDKSELKAHEIDRDLPSVNVQSGFADYTDSRDDINGKSKSKLGFKIDMPSFGIKTNENADGHFDEEHKRTNKSRSKQDFKIQGPNVGLPSVKEKNEVKFGEGDVNESEDENDGKIKSKKGFKIGTPSSFNLKRRAKTGKYSDEENDGAKYKNELDKPNVEISPVGMQANITSDQGNEGEENDRKKSKYGFSIGMPDMNISSFGLKRIGKADIGSDNDSEDEKDIKSESKNELKTGIPHINMPSFSLKGSTKKDKDSVIESQADNDFGVEKNNVNIPSVSIETAIKYVQGNESGDEKDRKKSKSKHGFKIEMPDISMASFNFKGNTKTDKDSGNIENQEKSKHELRLKGPEVKSSGLKMDEKYDDESDGKINMKPSTSKDGFKIELPDISMPSLNLKNTEKDSDDENQPSKSKYNLKLEGADVKFHSTDINVGIKHSETDNNQPECENNRAKSKHGFKIGMPSFNIENSSKTETNVDNAPKTKSDVKIGGPNRTIPSGSVLQGIKTFRDYDLEDHTENKTSKRTFKLGMPAVNIPKLNFKADVPDMQDINLKSNINTSNKILPETSISLGKEEISNNKITLKMSSDSDSEKKSKKDKKKTKEKSGFNFKFKGPEFSFPNFGSKHEKNMKEVKLTEPSENMVASQLINVESEGPNNKHPESNIDVNLKSDLPYSLKTNYDTSNNSEDFSENTKVGIIKYDLDFKASDISITKLETRKHGKLNNPETKYMAEVRKEIITSSSISSEEPDKQKDSDNLDWNIKFKDPKLSISKEIQMQNIEYGIDEDSHNFKIPDSKLSMGKVEKIGDEHLNFERPTQELLSHNKASGSKKLKEEQKNLLKPEMGLYVEMPNFKPKLDPEGYELAGTEYSLPDELKVEASSRNESTSGNTEVSDTHLTLINLPNINLRKSSTDIVSREQEIYEQRIGLNTSAPDIDTEPLDEVVGGLNVTDATKKKRFGFKIHTTDVTMPTFLKRSKSHEVVPEENQSDEMKSFNLKLKAPTVNIGRKSPAIEDSMSEEANTNMHVHLPLSDVLPRTKSKNSIEIESLKGKINLQYTEKNNFPDPMISLPKLSMEQTMKQNECDEWKIKGSEANIQTSNVSLLREKFNIKMKEHADFSSELKNRYEMEVRRNRRPSYEEENNVSLDKDLGSKKLNFNLDEPVYIISDLKLQSHYDPSLSLEGFSIPNLNIKENTSVHLDFAQSVDKISSEEINMKENDNISEYQNRNLSESDIQFDLGSQGKLNLPTLNVSPIGDINVSLDSSSMETESDLPEADSDFKRASRDVSLDVPIPKLSMIKKNLEESFNKRNDGSIVKSEFQKESIEEKDISNFGSVFGFRGFKKRGTFDEDMKDDSDRDGEVTIKMQSLVNIQSPHENVSTHKTDFKMSSKATKDLPEVDYDLEFKDELYQESVININSEDKPIRLPEGDENINYSIQQKLQSLEQSYNINKSDNAPQVSLECEAKHEKVSTKLDTEVENVKDTYIITEGTKGKKEDGDTSKGKVKIGIGFGFKSFNKSSDSEDAEVENKVSREPEVHYPESTEKARTKARKTFSFKGFGRSSSDTEEENLVKVSNNPMQRSETEDKSKISNKTNINFGFKAKSTKESDSEDNADNEKVDINPQIEGSLKKSKIKSNLGFGFMHKSKANESDSHIETTTESKKECVVDEEVKIKTKGTVNIGVKGNKDHKYDTKSESEGAEEEKLSMDFRGEDNRSKSRYGLGFGFRKGHGKNSSDSEGGDPEEHKVYLDEKGSNEKNKEPKSKSIKLGFKGFKNLKGKIQTEINKMRHDSPSTDEEGNARDKERKKVPKKKDKDKKFKRNSEQYLDTSEETAIVSAALASKDNRRKKLGSKSSSASSSDSSSDEEEKHMEPKKKKKSKFKRKEEGKVVTTTVMDVVLPEDNAKGTVEVDENISSTRRSFVVDDGLQTVSTSHVTIVRSEPKYSDDQISVQNIPNQYMELQSDPRKYVVVREMKLKENIPQTDAYEFNEVMEKVHIDRKISHHQFLKQQSLLMSEMETVGGTWGSDGDMGKRQIAEGEVSLTKSSIAMNSTGKQKVLTDSEELKRKAASLGDLSRLHEGGSIGRLLERAVSLDFKNASVGDPNLHVRRLQLPDSSATSIDEADETLTSLSSKKLELSGALKAASQWGTLEEAMSLGVNSNRHMKIDSSISAPAVIVKTTATTDEGAPISNIEISGERGSSITAVSVKKGIWDDSFEDDELPSLPLSPIPVEKTTITVMEDDVTKRNSNEYSGSDLSVVVVGSETVKNINNLHNLNFQLSSSMIASDTHLLTSHGMISSSNTSINSDSGRYSPRLMVSGENDDAGGVTVTMVPAESHLNVQTNTSGPNNPAVTSESNSSTPELISYASMQETPLVTISHDWMQENGEIVMETSEHNISHECITPESSSQKSMTQITLDGDGVSGYTVTEGTISRTVIISNPDSASPINIVQSDT